MKPNPNLHVTCLCSTNRLTINDDPMNIFQCIRCKNSFHISCYDNPTIPILNNTITCLKCRLDIVEPYWVLYQSYILQPLILPVNQAVDFSFGLKLNKEDTLLLETPNYKLAVFCTKLKSSLTNNILYEWPSESIKLICNEVPVEYNPYTYAFINNYSNNINLRIVSKEALTTTSVLGVSLVKKVDLKEIAKEVAKKNRLNYEEAKRKYKEIKESDIEFSAGIPTKDPMTSFFLYLPARGLHCDHISCFDLLSFISFNQTNYTNMRWKCPICKAIVNINEIVIDLFLHKIVKEIRKLNDQNESLEKYSHIFIDENEEWKPKEKFSNIWSNFYKSFKRFFNFLWVGQKNSKTNLNEVEIIEEPNQEKMFLQECFEIVKKNEGKPGYFFSS